MLQEFLGYTGNAQEEYLITIENTTQLSGQQGLMGVALKDTFAESYPGKAGEWLTSLFSGQSGVKTLPEKGPQRYHVVIKSLIQDDLSFNTEAVWSPSAAASIIRSTSNAAAQAITGRTLVNKFVSRRQWSGTSPLDFTINMRFESIKDNFTEVIRPCVELQRMILPSSGGIGTIGEWFLTPPGPNPFYVSQLSDMRKGEIINVRIGRFLNIKKVILKSLMLKFSPHFLKGGAPLSILATINFSAFEIFTKETLNDDMYDNNGGNYDLEPDASTQDATVKGADWMNSGY